MLDVVIALVPALVAAVVFFGLRALTLVLVSVLSCVLFETLFNKIRKRKNTVFDLSCVVTGILFAFNLPIVAPYWLAVFGAFFAIVVAKMLFGGLGKNFINPALSARAACLTSWPGLMSTWVAFPAAKTVSAFSEPLFSASKTFDGGCNPSFFAQSGNASNRNVCRSVFRIQGRLYRRNMLCGASARRYISACSARHNMAYSRCLYRNGRFADVPVPHERRTSRFL